MERLSLCKPKHGRLESPTFPSLNFYYQWNFHARPTPVIVSDHSKEQRGSMGTELWQSIGRLESPTFPSLNFYYQLNFHARPTFVIDREWPPRAD